VKLNQIFDDKTRLKVRFLSTFLKFPATSTSTVWHGSRLASSEDQSSQMAYFGSSLLPHFQLLHHTCFDPSLPNRTQCDRGRWCPLHVSDVARPNIASIQEGPLFRSDDQQPYRYQLRRGRHEEVEERKILSPSLHLIRMMSSSGTSHAFLSPLLSTFLTFRLYFVS
jgi:hypothetical protein